VAREDDRGTPARLGSGNLARILAKVGSATIFVQIAGFAASVALAREFGAVPATDAFFVAQSIPLFVAGVLLAAIRLGGIPTLTKKEGAPLDLAEAANELVSAAGAAAAALSLVVTGAAIALMPVLIGGAGAETESLARVIALELAPLPILMSMIAALSALLAVLGRYSIAVLALAIDPLMRALFTILFARSLGIEALAAGSVLGSALALVLLWVAVKRRGVDLGATSRIRSPAVREVATFSVPLLISYALLSLNPVLDRSMASPLGPGAVTELQLALQVFNVPATLLAAMLVAPILAEWQRRYDVGGWMSLRSSFERAVRVATSVAPPVVALAFVLREELVIAIYQGGALSPNAIDPVADALGVLLLAIPAQLLILLYATLFLVRGRPWVTAAVGFANVALNAVLNLVLRGPLDVTGIALSTTATLVLLTAAYAVFARRSFGPLLGTSPLRWARTSIAALAAAAVAALTLGWLPAAEARSEAVVDIAIVAPIGLVGYLSILIAMGGRADLQALVGTREPGGPPTTDA
jgi:putative peptidoglycan lipid II flippase